MDTSVQQSSESHSSMSYDVGTLVQVHQLMPNGYHHGKFNAKKDQIVDPSSPLRDIDEAHCSTLA